MAAQANADDASFMKKLKIGILGTGMMAKAHAVAWSRVGLPVFIASRNPNRSRTLAERVGNDCRGGSHEEMVTECNMILLATPQEANAPFLEKHKDAIKGKGKMIVDMSAWFAGCGWMGGTPAPKPHVTTLTYYRDILKDENTSFVKAWQSVMASSIANNKKQPMEVAGSDPAKKTTIAMLNRLEWEPLDCGSVEDARLLERRGPEQHKHPRQAEDDGEFRKWYPDGDKSKYPGNLEERYR